MEHDLITSMALKIMALESRVDALKSLLAQYDTPAIPSDCEEIKVGKYEIVFFEHEDGGATIDGVYCNGAEIGDDLDDNVIGGFYEKIEMYLETAREIARDNV